MNPVRLSSMTARLALLAALGCSDDPHVLASDEPARDASTQLDAGAGPRADAGGPGGSGGMGGTGSSSTAKPPACTRPMGSERACDDGADDDCDGLRDCADPDCDDQACGSGALMCTAGACIQPGQGLPELPRIDNVRVTQRGDTAIVDFEPVAGARDYRIYPLPDPDAVLVGAQGELIIKDAIYRCAGDRPFRTREDDPAAGYDASLSGGANTIMDFERKAADAVLGYVYLTPGEGRTPVYRMADPQGAGGFQNADWVAPMFAEANRADYVAGKAERDRLFAMRYRDDGIAFYVSDEGTRPVYRRLYKPQWNGSPTVFYVPGAEFDARAEHGDETIEVGERFKVLPEQEPGSVPLHRVLYNGNNTFDVLAAGEARYQRVLEQGNQPLWSLAWPGLSEKTTLVIEALDQGCPFPGGYVSAHHADADEFNYPSLTLDEARLDSGELFINGQHAESNRPKPIARAYVDVTPEPDPDMDWFEGFDVGGSWEELEVTSGNNGMFVYRNSKWAMDFSGCTENLTVGPLLGQLVVGYADYGSSCNMSITPRGIEPTISADRFLHVRMSTEVPSTGRRYPQLMITTTPVLNPGDVQPLDNVPLHSRLGPFPFEENPTPGNERTILVQPFGGYHELQIQACTGRAWGVSAQCPQANIYGNHAGNYVEEWEEPWLPVPLLGDVAGHDRPVRFDVYASTERVYVFMDDQPAGCAVLQDGAMRAGAVNVAFRGVLYHSGIDESVTPDDSGHQYYKRFSLSHFDRHMDDFGIDREVAAPEWDEARMPCATRWYGGE